MISVHRGRRERAARLSQGRTRRRLRVEAVDCRGTTRVVVGWNGKRQARTIFRPPPKTVAVVVGVRFPGSRLSGAVCCRVLSPVRELRTIERLPHSGNAKKLQVERVEASVRRKWAWLLARVGRLVAVNRWAGLSREMVQQWTTTVDDALRSCGERQTDRQTDWFANVSRAAGCGLARCFWWQVAAAVGFRVWWARPNLGKVAKPRLQGPSCAALSLLGTRQKSKTLFSLGNRANPGKRSGKKNTQG